MEDEIPKQKYMPNQWLKYKFGNSQAVSQVKGANFIKGRGWFYTLTNPSDPSNTVMISDV